MIRVEVIGFDLYVTEQGEKPVYEVCLREPKLGLNCIFPLVICGFVVRVKSKLRIAE